MGPLQIGDVLYVVTDGVDNFSESRPPAVAQAFLAGGIRLFAFAIANQGFAYGSGDLERIVADTGGVVAAASAGDWRAFQAARDSSPIGSALYEQHARFGLPYYGVGVTGDDRAPAAFAPGPHGPGRNCIAECCAELSARLFPCN